MRPVLALWSRCGNLEEWYAGPRHLAELVQQGTWAALECGHYLPEENPRRLTPNPAPTLRRERRFVSRQACRR